MTVVKEGSITITYRVKGENQKEIIEWLNDLTSTLNAIMQIRKSRKRKKCTLVFWRFE